MIGAFALLVLAAAPDPSQPLKAMIDDASGLCKRTSGEIVVCGRKPGESPYRLPQLFRDPGFDIDGPIDSVSRERHRLMDVGGAGAQQNACSATGAAGWTGCMVKDWKERQQQKGFRR